MTVKSAERSTSWIDDLVGSVFMEEDPRELWSLEVPLDETKIEPVRFEAVEIFCGQELAGLGYRAYTPKKRELKGSTAFRKPRSGPTTVLRFAPRGQDFGPFIREGLNGYKPTDAELNFFQSVGNRAMKAHKKDG